MTTKLDAILKRAVNLRPDQEALLKHQSDTLKFRHQLDLPEKELVYQCGCCQRIVPVSEMVANPCTSDGLSHYCRPCTTVKFQGSPMTLVHKYQDSHRISAGAVCAITGAEGNLMPFFYTFDASQPVYYLRRDYWDIFIQSFSFRLVGFIPDEVDDKRAEHPLCRFPATWFNIRYRKIDNMLWMLTLIRTINKTRPETESVRQKRLEIDAFIKRCILPHILPKNIFPSLRPETSNAA